MPDAEDATLTLTSNTLCPLQHRSLKARQDGLSVPQSLVVASVAGAMNVMATNPIWLTVTRMQTAVNRQGRASFFHEIRTLYSEGGLQALWRVCPPTCYITLQLPPCDCTGGGHKPAGATATCVLVHVR